MYNAAELKRKVFAVEAREEIEPIFAEYLASGAHQRPADGAAGEPEMETAQA
jgi:hypothetical protein